jgi:hypothetical protein
MVGGGTHSMDRLLFLITLSLTTQVLLAHEEHDHYERYGEFYQAVSKANPNANDLQIHQAWDDYQQEHKLGEYSDFNKAMNYISDLFKWDVESVCSPAKIKLNCKKGDVLVLPPHAAAKYCDLNVKTVLSGDKVICEYRGEPRPAR